jgi:hypothetical protein
VYKFDPGVELISCIKLFRPVIFPTDGILGKALLFRMLSYCSGERLHLYCDVIVCPFMWCMLLRSVSLSSMVHVWAWILVIVISYRGMRHRNRV